MSEEYSIGYDAGFQDGWNKAMDEIPPQRQWVGLTEEEILSVGSYTQIDNARAIEAKLKEKNT